MRRYRGYYDNGVSAGIEIEYYSEHRNHSKANMEDMKSEAYRNKTDEEIQEIIELKKKDILLGVKIDE